MKQPFFSIVIPTKDRPILLEDLLASIFNQEFQDYEIILSDNSDDNLTQEMLLKFSDERIQNVRRHGLNMADNWDQAIELCQGKYMLLFSDKMLLKQGSLEYLKQKIDLTQADCITWTIDVFCDTEMAFFPKDIDEDEMLSTYDLLSDMSKGNYPSYIRSAFHCSSCVSVSILEKIRADHGRVSFQLNPDFTMSFHVSLSIEQIYRLSESLTILRQKDFEHGYGNGHSFARKTEAVDDFLVRNNAWLEEREEIKEVPIHGSHFIIDIMLKDFYMILEMYNIDPNHYGTFEDRVAGYYFRVFNEITHRQSMHVDMKYELSLWKKLFAKEDNDIKIIANRAISKILLYRLKVKLIRFAKTIPLFYNSFVILRNLFYSKRAQTFFSLNELLEKTKI